MYIYVYIIIIIVIVIVIIIIIGIDHIHCQGWSKDWEAHEVEHVKVISWAWSTSEGAISIHFKSVWNKPKGLKVAKEVLMADRLDGP